MAVTAAMPMMVPAPVEMRAGDGECVFSTGSTIAVKEDRFLKVAEYAAQALRLPTGYPWPVSREEASGGIVFRASDVPLPAEGYTVTVAASGTVIAASDEAGAFYGFQTLRQLLPVPAFAATRQAGVRWSAPAVAVSDAPRFKWRGLMLDCSRTFQSPAYIRKTLDRLAAYKMNVLHLHLTDDQGWRIEIKKYPELTRKGARFAETYKEPEENQGFYTQEELRALIAYARARQITVVPEIEMPGHSMAALACYPHLSCRGQEQEIYPFGKGPALTSDSFCAGNEAAFEFFANVLAEVAELFPSEFIHVGGDEVLKDAWKACPKCQARMKAEGLKDEKELQSYFIRRAEKMLQKQGKRLIGWDEILEGGLAPNATVMSWRGIKGGVTAAKAGHDVVMSPYSHCYFDYAYTSIDTERVYSYEPVPAELTGEEAGHVLGVQANFWSHLARTPPQVDVQLFPRLLALAEAAWSPKAGRDYARFRRGFKPQLERLSRMGVTCSTFPMFDRIGAAAFFWKTGENSAEWAERGWEVPAGLMSTAGVYRVSFWYRSGAAGMAIRKVRLLAEGKEIAACEQRGWAGAEHHNHMYLLEVPATPAGARITLRADVRTEGGTDSNGGIWIERQQEGGLRVK